MKLWNQIRTRTTVPFTIVMGRYRYVDHILKSLHWLKVPERIEYKIISTTYKLLQFSSPQYLRDTITIQPSRSTRSSDLVTILRPPVQSRLRITNRSFRHAAPQLWNKLPHSFWVPYQSGSSLSYPLTLGSNHEPAVGLSHGMFHFRLKTYLIPMSFPP